MPLSERQKNSNKMKNGKRGLRCFCDCGTEVVAELYKVVNGHTSSCGCYKIQKINDFNRTHGLTNHELYGTFKMMMSRCYNPTYKYYSHYGARGIDVYLPWHDLAVFIEDIERILGFRPKDHTLDRVDNQRGYYPDNVRWASRKEQFHNHRPGCVCLGHRRLRGEL